MVTTQSLHDMLFKWMWNEEKDASCRRNKCMHRVNLMSLHLMRVVIFLEGHVTGMKGGGGSKRVDEREMCKQCTTLRCSQIGCKSIAMNGNVCLLFYMRTQVV